MRPFSVTVRFWPLCVAVVLEFGYQLHLAAALAATAYTRPEWYSHGNRGPRMMQIAGLLPR